MFKKFGMFATCKDKVTCCLNELYLIPIYTQHRSPKRIRNVFSANNNNNKYNTDPINTLKHWPILIYIYLCNSPGT